MIFITQNSKVTAGTFAAASRRELFGKLVAFKYLPPTNIDFAMGYVGTFFFDLSLRGLNRAPRTGPWKVGVERPGQQGEARLLLDFVRGGLATSGDTHRFIEHEGRRYSHILDVRTGYPVIDPPRSVTVAAACCLEAGLIATLSMLKGMGAEDFLKQQAVTHWCLR
jgi:hypothetical protein